MNGRRAVTGLSLLCALVFCAVSAPSAFALQGTTAFTCIPETGKGAFSDAHCTTETGSGFRAEEIVAGKETKVEGTNAKTKNATAESTPAKLLATGGGVDVEIICTTVTSSGAFTNKVVGGQMIAEGPATSTDTGCTVLKPQNKSKEPLCHVNEPIVAEAVGTTVVDAKGMYVTFKSKGANFTVLTFSSIAGKTCPAILTNAPLPITGTAAVDATGATGVSPSTAGESS